MSTYPHYVYEKPADIPFRSIEPIGHGGQGSVDAVEREGKVYARKTFVLSRTPKPMEFERVLQEVKIAGSILHTHVVRLIETYQRKNTYAIIMDPVAEGNLGTYLSDLDDIPKNEDNGRRVQLSRWFQCLAKAIAYIHSSGVRHRDIKPQNILTLQGNVLLTDFGISEEFQETTMSGSTEVLGTRTYRSPEREDRRRSGRREDIFSLGAVFLEMLTVCSEPGQLELLSEFRNGSYSQSLGNVAQWIQILLDDNEEMPFWYHTMLSVCGFMLEEKRVNRPYASDLLALWSCSTMIARYQVSFLPLSFCACIPELWYSKRTIWKTWPNALQHVKNNGEWAPEPQILAKWALEPPFWYMDVGEYERSEQERLIFGSSLVQTTLMRHEDRCELSHGALNGLSTENMHHRPQTLRELHSRPTAETAAAATETLLEKLFDCIDAGDTKARLYHELCIVLSGQFAIRLHGGAHSENHGKGEVCECMRHFHVCLINCLDPLRSPDIYRFDLTDFILRVLSSFFSSKGERFEYCPCHTIQKQLEHGGQLAYHRLSSLGTDIFAMSATRKKAAYLNESIEECLGRAESIIAAGEVCWRLKAFMEDAIETSPEECLHRERLCPLDDCDYSKTNRLWLTPFKSYVDFLEHIFEAHSSDREETSPQTEEKGTTEGDRGERRGPSCRLFWP